MNKSKFITRRQALITGLAGIGGLLLRGCSRPTPPNYGNLLRMGENFTYIAQRALLPGQSLAKEYRFSDVSSMPATGTTNPSRNNEDYDKLLRNAFADWQLNIEGSVSQPGSLTLNDLKKFPARTQITKHHCEEGWTAIAQWTGVPLASILQHAGIKSSARFVNFHTYDGWIDSIDLYDAFHPQTILAYGMNGRELPVPHGAPIRLRVEKQIGYKSIKYIHKIQVTDEFLDQGDSGWAWYYGI